MGASSISWAICKSAPHPRQIPTPAPHHSVFLQAGCPSCHPTNSIKALKKAFTEVQLQMYGKKQTKSLPTASQGHHTGILAKQTLKLLGFIWHVCQQTATMTSAVHS